MNEVYHVGNKQETLSTEQTYKGRLLSTSQVAKILNVHPHTLIRWIEDGSIEAITLPKKRNQKRNVYRIPGEAVDKLLHPEN